MHFCGSECACECGGKDVLNVDDRAPWTASCYHRGFDRWYIKEVQERGDLISIYTVIKSQSLQMWETDPVLLARQFMFGEYYVRYGQFNPDELFQHYTTCHEPNKILYAESLFVAQGRF